MTPISSLKEKIKELRICKNANEVAPPGIQMELI